jgi:myo-inositol-1(or 4)-monophosphatase
MDGRRWDDDELVALLGATADAVVAALGAVADWGPAGTRDGQHHSDLAADGAALAVLGEAGVHVLSEESGLTGTDGVVVVLDPLDGSTNAMHGIPWFAVSLCAIDDGVARAAVVHDVPGGRRFVAVRGSGATCDGVPLAPSGCASLADAVVGVSGYPVVGDDAARPGWQQFRALGACALDLCAVAGGVLDGYVDCSAGPAGAGAHGVWDYAGGLLVCREAGAVVVDALGRDLLVLDHAARRTPVAAATPALAAELTALARRSFRP